MKGDAWLPASEVPWAFRAVVGLTTVNLQLAVGRTRGRFVIRPPEPSGCVLTAIARGGKRPGFRCCHGAPAIICRKGRSQAGHHARDEGPQAEEDE